MKVEIWSDYVCPFCYIGKRNLEEALKLTGIDIEIEFKSFELDPQAKKQYEKNIDQLMADKYRMPLEQAKETNNRIVRSAEEVGLKYNFKDLKPTNTFDAHRLSHYAKEKGKLIDYTEALMKSYFTDSQNISDRTVLLDIASKLGLDTEKTARLLDSSENENEVRFDESDGYNRGVNGVPYFLFDRKKALYGAQPAAEFIKVIKELKE